MLTVTPQALEADQPGTMLTYRWLFQSDAESMFLDVVREQEMELREGYLSGVAVRVCDFVYIVLTKRLRIA